jgi:c-di-GMP-binding flagellar brake protein YcgR
VPRNKIKPKNEIKPDTRILIEIVQDEGNGNKTVMSLSSIVEEITDDGCLIISMPIHRGYYYTLPRETPITMYFFVKSRMYSLVVKYQERIVQGKLLYAKVRRLGETEPNQRRDCYRLPCLFPVTVERKKCVVFKGETVNFSDGGMLFTTNEKIEPGETLKLVFELDKEETVEAVALRLVNSNEGIYKHNVAVKFHFKCKLQKNRFYRFIVNRQRDELRRKAKESELINNK